MVISYQFKNEKTWYTLESQAGARVIDVKNQIHATKQIKSGTMLKIRNMVTGEDLNDDNTYIARDASLCIRRIPKYALLDPIVVLEEEKKLDAQLSEEEKMAQVVRNALSHRTDSKPLQERQPPICRKYNTTPPPNYKCHRCTQKGHFIQHCPTNGDPSFDIKIYRNPTGIPRQFLEETDDLSCSLKSKDSKMFHSHPNKRSFDEFFKRSNQISTKRETCYLCPICNNTLQNAFFVTCCFVSFCEECIKQRLVDDEATCIVCTSPFTRLDLQENFVLRACIAEKNASQKTS